MTKKSRPGAPAGGSSGRKETLPDSKSLDRLAGEVFKQLKNVRPTRAALQELLKRQGLAVADATRMTAESRDAVAAELAHLPAEQRKMLMWHWTGMTAAEIAERQAKSVDDVTRELAELLTRLRGANEESDDEDE